MCECESEVKEGEGNKNRKKRTLRDLCASSESSSGMYAEHERMKENYSPSVIFFLCL